MARPRWLRTGRHECSAQCPLRTYGHKTSTPVRGRGEDVCRRLQVGSKAPVSRVTLGATGASDVSEIELELTDWNPQILGDLS